MGEKQNRKRKRKRNGNIRNILFLLLYLNYDKDEIIVLTKEGKKEDFFQ